MKEPVIVTCPAECRGINDSCLPKLKEIVESGNVAFMMYGVHIREKVEELGYQYRISYQGKIPVGLFIAKEIK